MDHSPTLIVINGHSGAGKSTLARGLARTFVRRRLRSVALDLDEVVFSEASVDGYPTNHEVWTRARRVAAALTDASFAHGIDVVVMEGDFYARYPLGAGEAAPAMYDARADYLGHLTCQPATIFVALRVSADEALRRTQADPERRPEAVSRRPEFIRKGHDWYESLLLGFPDDDLIVDADRRTAEEVLTEVVDRIDALLADPSSIAVAPRPPGGDLRALFVEPRERRFRALFGLDNTPLSLLTSGYEKLVVLTPDRAFTFPRDHLQVDSLAREAEVLEVLDLEVAPRLLGRHADGQISPYPFLELNRLQGRSWDTVDASVTDEQAARMFESLARHVAQIQSVAVPIALQERPSHLAPLRVLPRWTDPAQLPDTLRALPVDVDACIERLQPILAMDHVASHGELSDGQLLVDEDLNVTGIVDWGGFYLGHPLRDLDFGVQGMRTSYRPAAWPSIEQRIWRAYSQARGVDAPPWASVALFWRLLDLEWLIARGHTRGLDRWIESVQRLAGAAR